MAGADLVTIVGPAFAAGLMIALTHAPLGIEVLKRGIIFIDLAIAQMAGLGIVLANVWLPNPEAWLIQLVALAFALGAALAFRLIERYYPARQEALIGCSFVLSASLALLVLADQPHGGEEIQHLLSGQILFVTWKEALMHAPVYAIILLSWFFLPRHVRSGLWFYILFAVAVTSSVQLVGVYVVFASLILPALAAGTGRHCYWIGWLCGLSALIGGIAVSLFWDLPTGPALVVSYSLSAVVIGSCQRLFAPNSLG